MDFLGGLMGGGNEGRREEYRNFANRYDEGAPYERISDEEAYSRYRDVAPNLSEDEYRLSAREAFERMSPREREEFGRMLAEETRGRGPSPFGGEADKGRFRDPDYLADGMSRMHREQPDIMGQLLGGMMGTGGSGLMGGALGGMMGGGGASGGPMSNPVAKAAIAGIAAMAVKRAMSGR